MVELRLPTILSVRSVVQILVGAENSRANKTQNMINLTIDNNPLTRSSLVRNDK